VNIARTPAASRLADFEQRFLKAFVAWTWKSRSFAEKLFTPRSADSTFFTPQGVKIAIDDFDRLLP